MGAPTVSCKREGRQKRATSPKSDDRDLASAKRIRRDMVGAPEVSLDVGKDLVDQGPSSNNGSGNDSTDNIACNQNLTTVSHNDLGVAVDTTRVEQTAVNKSQCLIVEVFSGSCRLAKSCRKLGFRTTAVDKSNERAESFTIYKCDLTNPSEVALFKEYLIAEQDALLHVHFAPACGTSSRARERPIKGLPRHRQPVPLRSDEFPDGLPHLSERDQQRVTLANLTYDVTADLIYLLISLMVSVSVENPSNSIFWLYSAMRKMLQQVGGHMSRFHSCMHGGLRDKETGWWSFNPRRPQENLFGALSLACDKSHQHASWRPYKVNGVLHFPTAQEAAYPVVLCDRVAHILLDEAKRCNFFQPQNLQEQLDSDVTVGKRHLFANQPRGQRLKPLVSEFGRYATMVLAASHAADLEDGLGALPRGSRVCSRHTLQQGILRDEVLQKYPNALFGKSWVPGVATEIVQIGVPKDPKEFLQDAIKVGHPRDMIARTGELERNLLSRFVEQPVALRFEKRAAAFKRWLKRSLELKEDEERLHRGLPPHLKPLLSGKRLLLWKEILVELKYSDVAVVDDICAGFPLTGWAKKTNVFNACVRKPDHNLEQLKKKSRGLNAAVVGSLSKGDWTDVDSKVWADTQDELDRGWLGPTFDVPFSFVAKRFGLVQKEKIRMIDDFSVCGINSAYGLTEKLRVQAVDELASFLALILNHPQQSALPKIVGRTYDLKSAYKQFGVDEFHHKHCRIGVRSPNGSVAQFAVGALPFGATGSVASFLRVAASVSFIAMLGLDIVLTNFFDDFTVLCSEQESRNVDFYLTGLFKILGLSYASEGDKAPPFGEVFGSLGMLFNLASFGSGRFTLEHTAKRKVELLQTIDELLRVGKSSPKDLERLHGRLVWFGSFVFGRQMNISLRALHKFSALKSREVAVTLELREALLHIRSRLVAAKPTQICRTINQTWIIFTDGAYEPGSTCVASIGGVLVSPQGNVVHYFGEQLNDTLVSDFEQDSEHPIYELEILPILVAVKLWSRLLANSQVVFYIDNEAARSAFIQGVGFTPVAKQLTVWYDDLEVELGLITWFGRVASHSNLADGPSRLAFDDPLLLKATRCRFMFPGHFSELGLATGAAENMTCS